MVTIWGTGKPLREFLYSDDMAAACIHLLELTPDALAPLIDDSAPPVVNIGVGEDLSIRALAELIRELVGVDAALEWDATKPDGTPRKLLDISRIASLGWRAETGLREGIARAYRDFLAGERQRR